MAIHAPTAKTPYELEREFVSVHGRIVALHWLCAMHLQCPWPEDVVRDAEARGQAAVAQWLLENGYPVGVDELAVRDAIWAACRDR